MSNQSQDLSSPFVSHSTPCSTQLQRRPNARYLDLQTDVNAKMRAILVDWLVEVAEEYKLCADTLYQVSLHQINSLV